MTIAAAAAFVRTLPPNPGITPMQTGWPLRPPRLCPFATSADASTCPGDIAQSPTEATSYQQAPALPPRGNPSDHPVGFDQYDVSVRGLLMKSLSFTSRDLRLGDSVGLLCALPNCYCAPRKLLTGISDNNSGPGARTAWRFSTCCWRWILENCCATTTSNSDLAVCPCARKGLPLPACISRSGAACRRRMIVCHLRGSPNSLIPETITGSGFTEAGSGPQSTLTHRRMHTPGVNQRCG